MTGDGRLLGALIAGGRSRRFGSDKALALLGGRPLLAHALDALRGESDSVVVCGRLVAGERCLADVPAPGMGPLGGIAAALREAARRGFSAVLTVPCDTPLLPYGLARLLSAEGPAVVAGQPLLGYWPSSLASTLEAYLHRSADRSMKGWALEARARRVYLDEPIANLNFAADLAELAARVAPNACGCAHSPRPESPAMFADPAA